MLIIARLKRKSYPSIAIRHLNCDAEDVSTYGTVHTYDCSFVMYHGEPYIVTCLYGEEGQPWGPSGELQWLLKQEVRMIASINLAVGNEWNQLFPDDPLLMLTPIEVATVVNSVDFRLRDYVYQFLDMHHGPRTFGVIRDVRWRTENCGNLDHNPEQVYNLIVGSGQVLTRCLSLWVKATMLSRYHAFLEEATSQIYFALDGLIKMLQRRLSRKYPGLSLSDTFNRLGEIIPDCAGMEEYAATCYNNRTMLVHPVNGFDDGWNVALSADDFYETIELFFDITKAYLFRFK
jgi:hypothetical protein